MSQHHNNKFSNPIPSLFRSIRIAFQRMTRRTMRSLLRVWMRINRQDRYGRAGFVLPTVVMVMLVVVLLSVTIMFRSMDRAKMAQYNRVSEATLNAAAPALERAKAKLTQAFGDAQAKAGTTPDEESDANFVTSLETFKFGDEDRLTVAVGTKELKTAWRFPADTDGNGKEDSYILYEILYARPDDNKASRTALQARAVPMPSVKDKDETLPDECTTQVVANDRDDLSINWSKRGPNLQKSVFVYITAVPIQNPTSTQETKSNTSFPTLEYHLELIRKSLGANAVVYDGDLEISPAPAFYMNGAIRTNSNLLVTPTGTNAFELKLLSSPKSCFSRDPKNSKITVAGNVVNGSLESRETITAITVDLHQGEIALPAAINTTNQSSSNIASDVAYNSDAYEQRIAKLVEAWTTAKSTSSDTQFSADDPPSLIQSLGRKKALELYFRDRTRKVPFKDVPEGGDAISADPPYYQGTKETLRPYIDSWAYSLQDSKIVTKLTLKADQMKAVKPSNEDKTEYFIGDRVQVGNGQPALQYNDANKKFNPGEQTFGNWVTKEDKPGEARLRPTQQIPQFNIAIDRDGFWEKVAAQLPKAVDEGRGGLRVITGAGVYKPGNNPDLPPLLQYDDPATPGTEAFPIVWPDTMPKNGDLQMRATAVYHYADNGIVDSTKIPIGEQKPIACVSSYYDPTTKTTADASNNGKVYDFPGRPSGSSTDLVKQANYVFPDGRFANKPLRDALDALAVVKTVDKLSLAQQSAIDTTACALGILDNTATASTVIPNMAIYERTLLDARQIKAVTKNNKATTVDETFTLSSPLTVGQAADLGEQPRHDLPLEQRQPLEVRVTVLDLGLLRISDLTTPTEKAPNGPSDEYLLPLSGLIYASREDALPDLSYRKPGSNGKIDEFTQNLVSRTDYKLDPTRSPDGIMLINGSKLFRGETNSESDPTIERGLTLATNNPVYVKGNFNLHTQEEFTDARLEDADYWTKFYDRKILSKVYGCRKSNGKDCTGIDEWRPATILADAINILSDNFREGYRNEGDFDLRNNAGNGVIAIGYDFDGDGIKPTDSIKESDVKLDLNGDEDQNDTILENEVIVTVKLGRLLNGFYENNFVTNGLSSGAFGFTSGQINFPLTGTPLDDAYYIDSYSDTEANANSSYFNNLVTPIQRRGTFTEYLMEICRKPMISACGPKDWVVGYDVNGTPDDEFTTEKVTVTVNGVNQELEVGKLTTYHLATLPTNPNLDIFDSTKFDPTKLLSGTTARSAKNSGDQQFPRRVAFLRDSTGKLILDISDPLKPRPVPWGISNGSAGSDNVAEANDYLECYAMATGTKVDPSNTSSRSCAVYNGNTVRPRLKANALWFQTRNSTNRSWDSQYPLWYFDPSTPATAATYTTATVQQPLLVPVLQIYATTSTAATTTQPAGSQATSTRWLPRAKDTTYNMVMAVGDVPGRPGETNGGLQNLARLLENWRGPGGTNDIKKTMILGSFMQLFRSAYATAPYFPVRNPPQNESFFGYTPKIYRSSGGGQVPFQSASSRQWGYDVALLKQVPDLFSTLFTIPKDNNVIAGNEYFREVGRDDEWVKQFVCNAKIGSSYAATNTITKPSGCP